MRDAFTLGPRFGGLYIVISRYLLALVHDNNHLSKLRPQILAHLHYDSLPKLKKLFYGILNVQAQHDGVCLGCASKKNTRGPFPSNENKTNDILHLIHSDICGLMPVNSVAIYTK